MPTAERMALPLPGAIRCEDCFPRTAKTSSANTWISTLRAIRWVGIREAARNRPAGFFPDARCDEGAHHARIVRCVRPWELPVELPERVLPLRAGQTSIPACVRHGRPCGVGDHHGTPRVPRARHGRLRCEAGIRPHPEAVNVHSLG